MPTYEIVKSLTSEPSTTVSNWWGVPKLFVSTLSTKGRDIATWAYAGDYLVPVNGSITGTAKENGVGLPYCVVCAYYRPTGVLIARTKADASGNFTFTGLDPTLATGQYFVVALDPDGGVLYNAIIYDRILAT